MAFHANPLAVSNGSSNVREDVSAKTQLPEEDCCNDIHHYRHLRQMNLRDAHIERYRSELTQPGEPDDARSDEEWLARVSGRLVFAAGKTIKAEVPKTLTDAISSSGKLHKNSEAYVFGKWLLLDGAPGLPTTRGVQPDSRRIVETLCCALHVMEGLGAKIAQDGQVAATDPAIPTKTNLLHPMQRMFGKTLPASNFDTRLKTLRRILDAYLSHIDAGGYGIAGKPITASPRLKKLQQKMKRRGPVSKGTPPATSMSPVSVSHTTSTSPLSPSASVTALSTGPAAVTAKLLPPLQIPLAYANADQKDLYRLPHLTALDQSKLEYTWHEAKAHSGTTQLRVDRRDMIILTPDPDIMAQSKLVAVIDRMAITLAVSQATNGPFLHKLLRAAGLTGIAHDRRLMRKGDRDDFNFHLNDLDPSVGTGTHFAILMQEPSPDKVAKFLRSVNASCKIVGDVAPFLLEFAVDFFSEAHKVTRRDCDPPRTACRAHTTSFLVHSREVSGCDWDIRCDKRSGTGLWHSFGRER